MFDTAELDQMRDDIAPLMPDYCNILNLVATNNGGTYSHAYGTVYRKVSCRSDGTEDKYKFTLPYSFQVDTTNLIQYKGGLFAVMSSNVDASWAVTRRVDTQKIINNDECVIRVYAGTINSYGEVLPIWTDGATYACKLDTTSINSNIAGNENQRADMTLLTWDADIRLPIEANGIDERSQIKITKQAGVNITPLVYGIASPDNLLTDGHHFHLRRVEPSQESS